MECRRLVPRFLKTVLSVCLVLAGCWRLACADETPGEPARTEAAPGTKQIRLEVFVRPDSDRSRAVLEVVKALEKKEGGLCVIEREVVGEQTSRERFWKLVRQHRVEKPVVPALYVLGRFHVGFRDAETTRKQIDEALTIQVFVRDGCPHCRDAKAFLNGLKQRWPALKIQLQDVVQDEAARKRMQQLAEQHRAAAVSLPCFCFCGQFRVGFLSDQTTGVELERLLEDAQPPRELAQRERRRPRIGRDSIVFASYKPGTVNGERAVAANDEKNQQDAEQPNEPLPVPDESPGDDVPVPDEGPLSNGDSHTAGNKPSTEVPEGIDLPVLGHLRVRDVGLPGFTIAIGLVDGFNPCAMWVLIFLLSILVNVRDRKKIIVIAGTFVVISGLAYFAFMAAWLSVFQLIGMARPAQISLGLLATVIGLVNVKDFVAFHRGITFSIPESAKPGIYERVRGIVQAKYLTVALFGAATLAVFVNIVEILCTAGLPAMYTQILTLQQLPAWKNYLYLCLYNLAYMFDDSVMLTIAVVTLSHRKLQEREGRWLKLVSGAVMLALGLTMVFRPEWLS